MKIMMFVVFTIFLASCSMTNQEIVDEVKFCENNGLEWHHMKNGFTLNKKTKTY